MRLLSDNPTSIDSLGVSATADLLSRILATTSPPFTLGLFGEWGSGKTTLMRMISEHLRSSGHKTVWFNAWKYDGKEVLWNALIQSIFYTMRTDPEKAQEDATNKFREKVGYAAVSLAKYAAKVAIRFLPGDIVKAEDVDDIVSAFKSFDATTEQYDFINKFEEHFDELVTEYVGKDSTLTVFIDDLDRCLPENAIAVLESLKLYLDRANCIFVIAAESGIIEEGIRLRYGGASRLSAADYIEKIVQLPFMMRGIESTTAIKLLSVNDEMTKFVAGESAKRLIEEGTGCNPRKLKRYLNTFAVLQELAGPMSDRERLILSKMLLIQMRFPSLFYGMLKDGGVAGTLAQILSLTDLEQVQAIAQSTDAVKGLYADERLRRFLRRTAEIPCDAPNVERWLQLTNGISSTSVNEQVRK